MKHLASLSSIPGTKNKMKLRPVSETSTGAVGTFLLTAVPFRVCRKPRAGLCLPGLRPQGGQKALLREELSGFLACVSVPGYSLRPLRPDPCFFFQGTAL